MNSMNDFVMSVKKYKYFLEVCHIICGIIKQSPHERSKYATQMMNCFASQQNEKYTFDKLSKCLEYHSDIQYELILSNMLDESKRLLHKSGIDDMRTILDDMQKHEMAPNWHKYTDVTTSIINKMPPDLQ